MMRAHHPSVAVTVLLGIGLALAACEKQTAISVERVEPAAGTTMGGDQVTIIGTGFQPGKTQADVLFGRKKADSIEIASATRINVVTPQGERGSTDVTVLFHDGKAFKIPGGFKYIPPADVAATRKAFGQELDKKAAE